MQIHRVRMWSLSDFSMNIVPELEIEGNWGAEVKLHGRKGNLIRGKAFALVSGLFAVAELRKELGWKLNSQLRERAEETKMVKRLEW